MPEAETRLVTVKPGDVLVFERDPDLSVIPVTGFPHD